ncbi:hypothetical protein ACIREE_35085 [Streptomyces sp. NPDC102467]|uniref:hypothetical protein n=1 Tax=Streptomyces sp. NPDC102467 TaxID=3366179 RepID=UPI0037F3EF57
MPELFVDGEWTGAQGARRGGADPSDGGLRHVAVHPAVPPTDPMVTVPLAAERAAGVVNTRSAPQPLVAEGQSR